MLFRRIMTQVIEQRRVMPLGRRCSIGRLGDKVGLPRAFSHGHQADSAVIEHRVAWPVPVAEQNWPQVDPIDHAVAWELDTCQRQAGGEDIHRGAELLCHGTGGYLARPPGKRRLTHTTFPGASFSVAQQPG